MESRFDPRIFTSDTMLNHRLSKKFKFIGRGKFNHLEHSQQTLYKGVCFLCIGNMSKKSQKRSHYRFPKWFSKPSDATVEP